MDDETASRELLWGSVTRLMDKIGDEEDRLQWPELIDMVVDTYSEEGNNKDGMDIFFNLYQFLMRVYYRIKAMDKPEPFNEVSKTTRVENHEEVPMFMVKNYDYKMFKWAKSKGFNEYMTNGWFLVRVQDLSPSERKGFESKVH